MVKISVITVCFNAVSTLEKTILSVINQTYPNIEYVIIDGGSTDGSVDIIKRYADRLAYWVSESDSGIYDAMNKGVARAKGVYCNFMNAGDCFYDTHVVEEVFGKKTIYGDIVVGNTILKGKHSVLEHSPRQISTGKLVNGTLNHQSSFIKKSLLDANPYNDKLRLASDWEFFFKELIINNRTYQHVDCIISVFQMGGLSNTSDMYEKEKDEVLKKILPACILRDYKCCGGVIKRYNESSSLGKKIISLASFVVQIVFRNK